MLSTSDIRRLRLRNQWLAPRPDTSPAQVVTHLGALQSQELWSGEWSIGSRSSSLDATAVHEATLHREILRTWPMRGTIHFVPAVDAGWMLELGRTSAFKGVERRRDFLGLSEENANAAVDVLREALADGEPVTRTECTRILEDAGVMTDPKHAYHLLWFAAQHGATCIGPQTGKEQTFVALAVWVADLHEMSRDDALEELAFRYFDSHGPAHAKELGRWSALPAADVRRAIELAGERLVAVDTELGEMLVSAAVADDLTGGAIDPPSPRVLLLSGFDEYMLGYGDRAAIMTPEQLKLVVPGANGVFRPTVVDDGTVVGTWKRAVKRARVEIAVTPFASFGARLRKGVEQAAAGYGRFLGLDAAVTFAD
ncbi:MAG: winged helix DNA-binding domain-containing protein [Acidimicrobiia bacterium]|nr:winged helix DNA-binding domain-containing protein [Acidimicrobiia bacterium]